MATYKYYPNSDMKKNQYFRAPEFRARLEIAKLKGRDIFYNEVRKLNNSMVGRSRDYISILEIFSRYWSGFKSKYRHLLNREGLIENVERFIGCGDYSNGYTYYECPNCDNYYMVGYTCKSRFCPSCGVRYKNKRSEAISRKLYSIAHRQFVFTIPKEFRIIFRKYRESGILNILFKTVNDTFNIFLEKHKRGIAYKENRQLGFISFIHTFGRDLKWNPHLHVLLAQRYVNNKGQMKKLDYFHYNVIRRIYMYKLFNNIYSFLKDKTTKRGLSSYYLLCEYLKTNYDDGLYVFGPPLVDDNESSKSKAITDYIIRYASHPPISESRITNLDVNDNKVSWYYDPHEDDNCLYEEEKLGRQFIVEDIYEFMKRLIIHIPSKYFHQIRYYGFYSNKSLYKEIRQRPLFNDCELFKMNKYNYYEAHLLSTYGYTPLLCYCGFSMKVNYELSYTKSRGDP